MTQPSVLENWLSTAALLASNSALEVRANTALELADSIVEKHPKISRGTCLAAFFDLLVAEEYYKLSTAAKWLSCPTSSRYHHPYTNACPGCLEAGTFHYTEGKKPVSATVGRVVAQTLRTFIKCHMERLGRDYVLYHAVEPMDLVIVSEKEKRVFAGEIKAAPLLTLPLQIDPESVGRRRSSGHATVDLSDRLSAYVTVPRQRGGGDPYKIPVFAPGGGVWGVLSAQREIALAYVGYWSEALEQYARPSSSSVRWLSNSCGAPPSGTVGWPARDQGSGFKSISDGKSSVGMDRTDDLKKAVYQLLKIGVELRSGETEYVLHTGILSNIHPIRHGRDYIYPLLDVVWGHGTRGDETDLSGVEKAPSEMFYLIDGLIALTEQKIQDPWVEEAFSL